MLRYKAGKGRRAVTFKGDSPLQVVQDMHRAAWLIPRVKADYMREVAERCLMLYDVRVLVSSPADFLNSLVSAGLLRGIR
jgi:hypothetical protein